MKDNSTKQTAILTTIVCLIPIALGAALYTKLPETIATHWDLNGNPNGWSSRFLGVIGFPAILALINLIFPVLLKMDPRHDKMDPKVSHLLHWIIPCVSLYCSGTTLAVGLGMDAKITVMEPVLLGVIFTAIGNYMPKMSPSYTVGIKLPWTLHSEANWEKTHRMAGFLWVVGGILMIITGLLGAGVTGILVIAVVMVVVPIVYSYLLYKKGI